MLLVLQLLAEGPNNYFVSALMHVPIRCCHMDKPGLVPGMIESSFA